MTVVHDLSPKKGLAHCCINISFIDWTSTFCTSKIINDKVVDKRGRKSYDINTRSVIALREIGKGYSSLKTFCGLMNMPPPMTQKTFLELQNTHVAPGYIKAAQDNMISAGNEVRQANGVDNNGNKHNDSC